MQENSNKNDNRYNQYEQIRIENRDLNDRLNKLSSTNSQLVQQVFILYLKIYISIFTLTYSLKVEKLTQYERLVNLSLKFSV